MRPSIGKTTAGLGYILINLSRWMIKHGLKLKELEVSAGDVRKLAEELGAENWFWDNRFYYVSLEDWNKIISKDLTNRIKWISNKRDCDNRAAIFKSHVSEYFELNGVGIAIGEVRDKSGNHVGYHAWDILITDNGLYFYDVEWDSLVEAEAGSIIGEWSYYPWYILWY